MEEMFLMPLLGGVLIGLAATLMLFFNGRVMGVSGIINGLLSYSKGDMGWRIAFVLGVLAGGLVLNIANPELFANTTERSMGLIALAGFLVGFGTIMGSGCTSGHGVCGISRFSPRSLIATVTFIVSGIIAATGLNALFL